MDGLLIHTIHFVLIGIFFRIDGKSWKIFILVIGSQIYRLNEILSGTDIKFGFKIFFQQTWQQQLTFFSLGSGGFKCAAWYPPDPDCCHWRSRFHCWQWSLIIRRFMIPGPWSAATSRAWNKGPEKAPTRVSPGWKHLLALSHLRPLLRHYAKWTLTPQ